MAATTNEIGQKVIPLLVELEEAVGYTGAKGHDHAAFFEGMHLQAARIGVPYPEGSTSWYAFHTGANHAYPPDQHNNLWFCFPNHPLEVRIYTGIYTWLATFIDDIAQKNPEEWHQFTPRFLVGAEQSNHVAREWDRWLRLSYQHYSPTTASFIITSSLNFASVSALEASDVPRIVPTPGGKSWPQYLRDKTGIGEAYALMTFPKVICPDVSYYIEAIRDMDHWICKINDIFSFYKEECAGEKDNYMHTRAFYEGIDVYETLRKVSEETMDAYRRIELVLEGKDPYAQLWHDHVLGYVSFHTVSERYKLRDLGLDESLPMN
ncbi:isoprenoid synthase domain-containing protein [Nemania serpens]|nr:isoprenoid synthase domain-containing protein [Nemania serpens]